MASPRCFWRVEDENSQARTRNSEIRAAGVGGDFRHMSPQLRECLERHLDWADRTPSPFISAYCDEDAANREVNRRLDRGKRHVTITKIDVTDLDYGTVEFRNLRRLAANLGLWIQELAWNNSEHEYIFLHHIPSKAIEDVIDFPRVQQ
ncbi:hypothetical protein F4678DRAFT_445118 [Xylaria arbuscula]|nr:hypothetical protein F4678DRAFT_445118 [Xylaria arbuscula]